jgi:hypothetical protein
LNSNSNIIGIESTTDILNNFEKIQFNQLSNMFGFVNIDPQHVLNKEIKEISLINNFINSKLYKDQINGTGYISATDVAWFVSFNQHDHFYLPVNKDFDVYTAIAVMKLKLEGYHFEEKEGFTKINKVWLDRIQLVSDNDCFRESNFINVQNESLTDELVMSQYKSTLKYKVLIPQTIISDRNLSDIQKVDLVYTWIKFGNIVLHNYASYLVNDENDIESKVIEIKNLIDISTQEVINASKLVKIIGEVAVLEVPDGYRTSPSFTNIPYIFKPNGVILFHNFMNKGINKATIMQHKAVANPQLGESVVRLMSEKGETWGGSVSSIYGSDINKGTMLTIEEIVEVAQKAFLNSFFYSYSKYNSF